MSVENNAGATPVVIRSIAEKWRFECTITPEVGKGHTNWFPIDGKFRCQGCVQQRQQNPGLDPDYSRLRDKKTGGLVAREDIELAVDYASE